jgi:hypothetical protein
MANVLSCSIELKESRVGIFYYNIYRILEDMTECALNTRPNKDGSCFTADHINLITQYTDSKNIVDIKKETNCSDDKCILSKINIPADVQGRLEREALKVPTSSYDHNYWLNNTELDTVMSQLRYNFPGFAHGFIHMIDLKAFVPANIHSFDYPVFPVTDTDFANEFKYGLIQSGRLGGETGYTPRLSTRGSPLSSYGIVCNTDNSNGGGQHWFAIFISTDQQDPNDTSKPWIRIECFNSAGGGSTNKAFNDFWYRQAIDIARLTGLRCTYDIVSSLQHQGDTGNCGSYSLFYIYSRLNGIHPSEFDNPKKIIKDHSMQQFRKVCFQLDKDALF